MDRPRFATQCTAVHSARSMLLDEACNHHLPLMATSMTVVPAHAGMFAMNGSVTLDGKSQYDPANLWNQWMDHIRAERGSAQDMQTL